MNGTLQYEAPKVSNKTTDGSALKDSDFSIMATSFRPKFAGNCSFVLEENKQEKGKERKLCKVKKRKNQLEQKR
jgi:hypothetical protein